MDNSRQLHGDNLGVKQKAEARHWNGDHRRRTKVTKKMISSAAGCAEFQGAAENSESSS